jgi:hypothetical protein
MMGKLKLIYLPLILITLTAATVCHYYPGFSDTVISLYGGNFFLPFAIFFIIRYFPLERYIVALIALGGIYLQELGQWIGMYSGIFDAMDLLIDLLGVLAAIVVDKLIHKYGRNKIPVTKQ